MLDEPVAGMSVSERARPPNCSTAFIKDRSVLVIEHDMKFVETSPTRSRCCTRARSVGRHQEHVKNDPRLLKFIWDTEHGEVSSNGAACSVHLSPPGRGRNASPDAIRVRGVLSRGPEGPHPALRADLSPMGEVRKAFTRRDDLMLAISDLHVAYGQSEVLHGLNVSVAPNEIVAIMGRNGMGKTTLMKSLMGILPTKSGSVTMKAPNSASCRAMNVSPRASPMCRRAA